MYAQLHLELQEMKLRSAARQLNYAGISCRLPPAACRQTPPPSSPLDVCFRSDWLADCLPRLSADNCSPWPPAPHEQLLLLVFLWPSLESSLDMKV